MKQLTDVATFTEEITVPENGDLRNAESVEVPFQGLANRTANLRDGPVAHPQGFTRTINGVSIREYISDDVVLGLEATEEILRIPDADIPDDSVFHLDVILFKYAITNNASTASYSLTRMLSQCRKSGSLNNSDTEIKAGADIDLAYDSGDITISTTGDPVDSYVCRVVCILYQGPLHQTP